MNAPHGRSVEHGLTDPRHRSMARALAAMRFLGSFAFGCVAAVRILHFENVGITTAQIGALMAGYSVITALVEIPSGALADVWGRRRTRLLAAVVLAGGFVGIGAADQVATAAPALVLVAVGRALASGAAESWFVDEIGDAQHPSVLEGVSKAEAAHSVGTALGALVGGLLPFALSGRLGDLDVFVPVFALAAAALLADALVTLTAMRETTTLRDAHVAGVWSTTLGGVRLTLATSVCRWVSAVMIAFGALLACTELLTPLALSGRFGGDRAAIWFGIIVAGAWLAGAWTAARAPQIERWIGSAGRAGGLGAITLAALTLPSAFDLWITPAIAFVVLNVVGGPLVPLLGTLIHRHVDAAHRSTAISTFNLSVMAGATVGSLLVSVAGRFAVPAVVVLTIMAATGLLRSQHETDVVTIAATYD